MFSKFLFYSFYPSQTVDKRTLIIPLTFYSQIQYFTTYMIALANSCQQLIDITELWKPDPATNYPPSLTTQFNGLVKAYQVG